MSSPNQTLFIYNLNVKESKADTKRALYALFATYGTVIDVIALRTNAMRGRAHVVFRDIASATNAMRQLQGFVLFDRALKIEYAKGKSDSIAKLDGTFVLRKEEDCSGKEIVESTLNGLDDVNGSGKESGSRKRPHEGGDDEDDDDSVAKIAR